jgi:methyltransferase of FxLD system
VTLGQLNEPDPACEGDFRDLGQAERALLSEHVPAPAEGGLALDVGCGTGELAAHLATIGYRVDAVNSDAVVLDRARCDHDDAGNVRWLRLDIERDDPAPLGNALYDVVVFRSSVAFLHDRTRVLHTLGRRLRKGGTLLVITPLAAHTPAEKRHIALDEDEITALTCGWTSVQRIAVGDLAALVLRGPCADTVAVERSVPATGYAVAGALAIVTDEHGRVLLGWSKRGMWEAPGGKIEGTESLERAGVRELAEETGLCATGATVVTILTDAAQGVPRVTAVIRISGITGTLTTAEPETFTRWEWHDPHALGCLGPVFTPAANALDAVWPGIIPGLPPVHDYPHAVDHPAVPGEPAEAVRLRHQMTDAVIAGGWAPTPQVQHALRTVPRHRFAPEKDLPTAYDDDLALITRRDTAGRATSSVSAAWLQADMLEAARIRPGHRVLEIGSGGYNAALVAELAGPTGHVTTVDIDPAVTTRATRFLAQTGYHHVRVVTADAEHLPAGVVPDGGFDAIVVTVDTWDLPWIDSLAEGGRLVAPLRLHGYHWAIGFTKDKGSLHSNEPLVVCGFVAMQGDGAWNANRRTVPGTGVHLAWEDGTPLPVDQLVPALTGEPTVTRTNITVGGQEPFDALTLHLAGALPGFCRLSVDPDSDNKVLNPPPRHWPGAAIVRGASLARLATERIGDGDDGKGRYEFVVHGHGTHGHAAAQEMAEQVAIWQRNHRGARCPLITAHPAAGPAPLGADHEPHVFAKKHTRITVDWPIVPGSAAALPTAPGAAG